MTGKRQEPKTVRVLADNVHAHNDGYSTVHAKGTPLEDLPEAVRLQVEGNPELVDEVEM